MSRTSELNDSCFNLATELAEALSSEFESELGTKPTPAEFAEILNWGIRSCSHSLFSDAENDEVAEIRIRTKKRKSRKPKPGDVIAIPSSNKSEFHMVVYIGRFGSFGDAFGILKGTYGYRNLPPLSDLNLTRCHKFVGIESIREGKWKVVENRPDILGAFSKNPEYFHSKKDHLEDTDIGLYGSAEKPYVEGQPTVMRNLSQKESIEIGLNDPQFRMGYLEEGFEDFLNSRNKRT